MFWPALVLAGLGVNYKACKDLDDVVANECVSRPLTGFWGGISIGVVCGLWAGWSVRDLYSRMTGFSFFEWLSSELLPWKAKQPAVQPNAPLQPQPGQPYTGLPPYPQPPSWQMQQPPPYQSPPYVNYQQPQYQPQPGYGEPRFG